MNGFAVDSHGISYVVFTGIIETPPSTSAFATVSIYENHLNICGHGMEQSHSIPFEVKKNVSTEVIVDDDLGTSPIILKVKV